MALADGGECDVRLVSFETLHKLGLSAQAGLWVRVRVRERVRVRLGVRERLGFGSRCGRRRALSTGRWR